MEDPYRKLTRLEASDAVTRLGWRLVLGELRTEVRTGSLALAADVAARVATVHRAVATLSATSVRMAWARSGSGRRAHTSRRPTANMVAAGLGVSTVSWG